MKEHDFLQVLEALSILGKNVKNELGDCLKLRNGCGNPNSRIAESRCAAHIEGVGAQCVQRIYVTVSMLGLRR
jgi:hypothetical protein